ncbi:Uncharacterised protein [Salmonella enterica subsp. enterica]|uniref:Uncharacterized protein n=1 Tax=Salmonella enterica I TaxID=59201 RepID=A0A447TP92_SALET|nr:Uncharacterised protein [Salmonella enterica subsp. enterica]
MHWRLTGCLLCLLLLVMLGWKKLICHYHAGSIMAVFTEAKTHGVRRICWPDNASRDLSGQHLLPLIPTIVFYVQYDRDRHLYADTRRQMFRHRQYPR